MAVPCKPPASRTAGRQTWKRSGFSCCAAVIVCSMSACGAADHACSTRLLVEGVQESVVVEAGPCSAPPATGRVKVWVDLAMPAMAAVPMPSPSSRSDYYQALQAQQSGLSARLHALGATELARVYLVRNAIVVELPARPSRRCADCPACGGSASSLTRTAPTRRRQPSDPWRQRLPWPVAAARTPETLPARNPHGPMRPSGVLMVVRFNEARAGKDLNRRP